MLPPTARLRRREDFSETVRVGARAGSAVLVVHLESSSPGDASRAGFIVSRSVGDAVTRNLVRRRLRHLVRDRLDQLPAGSRLVVRALAPAGAASHATLAAQLDRALARLSVPAGAR